MIPGDPYETKELDEARSRHRRIRAAAAPALEWVTETDSFADTARRPAVEHYARRAADTLLDRHEEFVAYLEAQLSSDLLDADVRALPDDNSWRESSKSRVLNGGLTHRPTYPPVPDDGPDDDQRRRELREALLLIDIAEAHAPR